MHRQQARKGQRLRGEWSGAKCMCRYQYVHHAEPELVRVKCKYSDTYPMSKQLERGV